MPDATQDPAADITYLDDWTAHLARNGLTMTTATVTADGGATVSNVVPTTTGVRFKLDTSGVTFPPATTITVTTTATLSNGDTDVRHYQVQVTNT